MVRTCRTLFECISPTFMSGLQEGMIMYVSLIQTALVICGLFVYEFANSHLKNDLKWQFSSHKWTFYLRIQDSLVHNDGTHLPQITRETCISCSILVLIAQCNFLVHKFVGEITPRWHTCRQMLINFCYLFFLCLALHYLYSFIQTRGFQLISLTLRFCISLKKLAYSRPIK